MLLVPAMGGHQLIVSYVEDFSLDFLAFRKRVDYRGQRQAMQLFFNDMVCFRKTLQLFFKLINKICKSATTWHTDVRFNKENGSRFCVYRDHSLLSR